MAGNLDLGDLAPKDYPLVKREEERAAEKGKRKEPSAARKIADAVKGMASAVTESVERATPNLGGERVMDKATADIAQQMLKLMEDHVELIRQSSAGLQEDNRFHKKYLEDLIRQGQESIGEQRQIGVFLDRATRALEVQTAELGPLNRAARWLSIIKDGLISAGLAYVLWQNRVSVNTKAEAGTRPNLREITGGRS